MPTRHLGSPEVRRALDIFIKLNRACQSVNRRASAPIREGGLTSIQFGVLDAIVYGGPMPVSALAEKNLCSQNSLSSVIDTMERHQLVKRTRCPRDRRVVHVSITEDGRARFEELWPAHLNLIAQSCAALEPVEQQELDRLLRKLGRWEG